MCLASSKRYAWVAEKVAAKIRKAAWADGTGNRACGMARSWSARTMASIFGSPRMDVRRSILINSIAFALALIGTLVAQAYGMRMLEFVCKPAMLIILSSWFFFSSRRYGDRFTILVQAGLFFSLLGDVALMFQHKDEFNFLIGLAAFMVAHLCYSLAFAHNALEVGDMEGLLVSILIGIAMISYAFFFSYGLVPYLDESLSIPVIAYVVAISLMGITAGLRFKRTYPRSFWFVMIGAVLFVVSDSLLARNRFIRPFGSADLLVMLTYGAAQYLIVAGSLIHVLDPEEIRRRQALRT